MRVVQTDLNTPCKLVRGNPDGGRPIAILKTDDVIKNSAQEDFISFGSAECDDQVCVRDSAFTEDAGDSSPEAHGYCSTYCTEGSNSSCQSATGALDSNPTTKLSCRALLLDSATLAAIKMSEPGEYAEDVRHDDLTVLLCPHRRRLATPACRRNAYPGAPRRCGASGDRPSVGMRILICT